MNSQQIPATLAPFSHFTDINSLRNNINEYDEHLSHDSHGHQIMVHGPYSHADGGVTVSPVLAINQPEEQPQPIQTVTNANTQIANTENEVITDFSKITKVPNISYYAIGGAIAGLIVGKIFQLPLGWSAILFSAGSSFYAFHKSGGTFSTTTPPATQSTTSTNN